jgi:hypothetical protein
VKLVVTYTVGDGCTYSFPKHVAVEYGSEEAFLVHFEQAAWRAHKAKARRFNVGGYEFETYDFIEFWDDKYHLTLPDVRTLEAWFEQENKNAI